MIRASIGKSAQGQYAPKGHVPMVLDVSVLEYTGRWALIVENIRWNASR